MHDQDTVKAHPQQRTPQRVCGVVAALDSENLSGALLDCTILWMSRRRE